MKDRFSVRAEGYDETDYRLNYVEEMAKAIRRKASLSPEIQLIDFGAGTGLLTERLAPFVGKIIAVDISPSMIGQLQEKAPKLPCHIETIQMDLTKDALPDIRVDGIVSTMTLHHIADPLSLLGRLFTLLRPGGFLVLCDIDSEDGSFHTIDTGVEHYGFERATVKRWMEESGFLENEIVTVTTIAKPHGDYTAFLAYGIKPSN